MKTFTKLFCVIVLSLLFNQYLHAQVVINGQAIGAEGRKIKVYKIDDFFSMKKTLLANSRIDTSGSFDLNIDIDGITYVQIYIDNHKSDFYLEKDKHYMIMVKEIEYNKAANQANPFAKQEYLPLELVNFDSTDINVLIGDLNYYFSKNIKYYQRLLLHYPRKYVPIIDSNIRSEFIGIENEFFNDVLDLRMASLWQMTKKYSAQNFYNQFFATRVKYNNPEYMYLFKEYFTNYINASSTKIDKIKLSDTINSYVSWSNLLDFVGRDSLLINEEFRELVVLYNINELYYNSKFNNFALISILEAAEKESKFENHRVIAKNLLERYSKTKRGSNIPNVFFVDDNQNKVYLSSFKGKYVYLSFFTSTCIDCIMEMSLLDELGAPYQDSVVFVNISLDNTWLAMHLYLKENGLKGNYLHYNSNMEILDYLEVEAIPKFIMLDKDGNIYQNPASEPSKKLLYSLYYMFNKQQ